MQVHTQRMRCRLLRAGLAVLVIATVRGALAAPPPNFTNELVVSGLNLPTALIFLPDGRMLAGEKDGRILIADPSSIPATPATYMTISDIAVDGEQGLIDIQLDPDFDSNGYFYAYYSKASTGRFRIARFDHLGSTGDLGSETVIWEDTAVFTGIPFHHGGAIGFGPDGKLYLTTGEKFQGNSAQDLTSTLGKVLRMNLDGSAPADNPFVDGAGGNDDHVWAYGLRNPFRARWDLPTARFFIGEVGGNDHETAWEDVNLGVAGANYGWPFCEGNCSDPQYTDPLFTYPHLGAAASLTGGIVYRGTLFPASFQGAYFYADYVRGWMRCLTFDAFGAVSSSLELDPSAGAVVDIKQGPNGELYYCELITGEIRRYVYGPGIPVARDDRAYVAPGGAVVIDVLANDEGNLDPATVAQVAPPSSGGLGFNAVTGEITYTHNGSATLADSFSYTVDDTDGDTSNVAEVTIKVLTGDCTLVVDGLALHLEADSGVSVSGSDVTAWADQSGLGNDLTVSSGAPQWVAGVVNGQPVVRMNGIDDALGSSVLNGLPVGTADRTMFMVVQYRSDGWGGFTYGNPTANEAFGLTVSPGGFLAVQGYLAPLDFISATVGNGAGLLVQSAVVDAGMLDHFRDGELIDSRAHSFGTVADRIRLGASIDDATYVDTDVAAVLVYNRALDAAERQTVEDYLQIKYFVGSCDNLTPYAVADSAVVAPGGVVEIDVLGNDSDADGTLDATTVTIVDPSAHAASLVVHPTTGAITYTHDGSATTADSFTYKVADDDGALSNVATVTLIVRDDDCNTNGIPDVDEFSTNCADNEPIDCNFDGVLDECDPDCDASGTSDVCELTFGLAFDCAGTNGFVGDFSAGQSIHTARCAGCHNVGGVGGLGGAPNHRNHTRYQYQRKVSACQQIIGHGGGSHNLTIDDFAHLERYLTDFAAPTDTHGGDGVPDYCQGLADCDADGIADICALAAGLALDCNTNGVPDNCDVVGGGSADCNTNGIPDECDGGQLFDNFDEHLPGEDPDGWYDTAPDNSMVQNDALFSVFDVGGETVFGTETTQANIHSHYVAGNSAAWSAYEFTGRMRISASGGGTGVTFFSDYPNSDWYYRLRRGNFVGGHAFHIDPHGTLITGGDIDSGVVPAANTWYRFRIQVVDTATQTEIRANVWQDGAAEPTGWQIGCYDDSGTRRRSGTVGVWAFSSGAKYWDDFVVTAVPFDGTCDDGDPCTVDDFCSNGVCTGTPIDCSAFDDVCGVGVCNPASGACETVPGNEGAGCDDGSDCTALDVCSNGVCAGEFIDCSAEDGPCAVGVCNELNGLCEAVPANEGAACDDVDACTVDDACSNGVCLGVFADCDGDTVCDSDDNCTVVSNLNQLDTDMDGFGDACDALFDFDHDGDIDTDDLAALTACLTGPVGIGAPGCVDAFDLDLDDDLDLVDFAGVQRDFTGSIPSPCE